MPVRARRGNRANLNTLATAGSLLVSELFHILDEGKLALALSASSVMTLTTLVSRVPRTSNVQITNANDLNWIDVTSGTFTQTFAAASALGNGFRCIYRNGGTGDITFDPNGSETIDGLTSFISYPGEVRLIHCDGTALRSMVLSPGAKTFTFSDNFVWPPGINGAVVDVAGGGSGGSRPSNGSSNSGSGGGGGGRDSKIIPPLVAGVVSSVTVGSGGVGATTAGGTGTVGGSSNFADLVGARGAGNIFFLYGGSAGLLDTFTDQAGTSSGATAIGTIPEKGGAYGNGGGAAAGTVGGKSNVGGGGGGGGGGGSSSSSGGPGGSSGLIAGGSGGPAGANAGGNGNNGTGGNNGSGGGGGGGFGTAAGAAGKGGNGGFPGGGGGGGGTSSNNPGAGGNGGAGVVIVRMF